MSSGYLYLGGLSLYIIGISIHAAMLPLSLWKILIGVLLPPADWYRSTRRLIRRTGVYSSVAIIFSAVAVYFALAIIIEIPTVAMERRSFHWLIWVFFTLWFLCPLLTTSRYVYGLVTRSSR